MGVGVHSAVVLVDRIAGAITLAAPDAGARGDEVAEKVGNSYLACRDTSKTWGDARFLTSIYLATE